MRKDSVVKKYLITVNDGKNYSTKHHLKAPSRYLYSLTAGLFLVYLSSIVDMKGFL